MLILPLLANTRLRLPAEQRRKHMVSGTACAHVLAYVIVSRLEGLKKQGSKACALMHLQFVSYNTCVA